MRGGNSKLFERRISKYKNCARLAGEIAGGHGVPRISSRLRHCRRPQQTRRRRSAHLLRFHAYSFVRLVLPGWLAHRTLARSPRTHQKYSAEIELKWLAHDSALVLVAAPASCSLDRG